MSRASRPAVFSVLVTTFALQWGHSAWPEASLSDGVTTTVVTGQTEGEGEEKRGTRGGRQRERDREGGRGMQMEGDSEYTVDFINKVCYTFLAVPSVILSLHI